MKIDKTKKRKSFQDFSLIELLVVVSIIMILASLLMPALSKAKSSGKRIACLSNVKQFAVGVFGYTNDFNGWMPVSNEYGNAGYPSGWKFDIAPYLSINPIGLKDPAFGRGVFSCPSWEKPAVLATEPALCGGYGWNVVTHYESPAVYGFGSNPPTWVSRVKLNSTTKPSESIVCGEAVDSDALVSPSYYWAYSFLYSESYTNGNVTVGVGHRHSMGVNMLWADGHASWNLQSFLRNGANSDCDWYYKRVK